MRPRVLAASMSLVLILSGRVVVQTIQNPPPDHDHPAFAVPGARQLAVEPFTTLPKGVLFLRLENFSTTKAAEDAATSASAVVEWAGKIWLFTLGSMGVRSSGGTRVAEIGPVPDVPAAASYVLDINEADFGPEMKAQVPRQVHTHPGPEIFFLLTGEHLGGHFKTDNLWTVKTDNYPAETGGVLLRRVLGAQVGLHFGTPASRAALEDVRVM